MKLLLVMDVLQSASLDEAGLWLSDLAVRLAYQRRGIGTELIRRTLVEGGKARIFLFAAPAAVDYYPRVGFTAGSGWILDPSAGLR